MPNFLIDPQDSRFTRYFERSSVSTPDQECDEPHYFDHPYTSYDSSPDSVLSPLRSRATSIALKKLMETQMQMLLDISAAWKKNAAQPASFLPANPIFPSAQLLRKIRSMSQKSSVSLASLVDRLSLRDKDNSSLSADVESYIFFIIIQKL
ncbi:hypothetical protein PtB15_3B779 [Puccinia triticina]|nr:hypothetical protein PtB15_3B779 [Puccinia triticina]